MGYSQVPFSDGLLNNIVKETMSGLLTDTAVFGTEFTVGVTTKDRLVKWILS